MLNEATLHFVSQHTHDDVRMLALRGCKDPEVNLPLALQQIQGRQTARRKLPSWAAIDGIVYPPHLNMEQCSSEATAQYKAKVVSAVLSPLTLHPSPLTLHLSPLTLHLSPLTPNLSPLTSHSSPLKLIDLTGGFGVDFAFMSEAFDEAVYVERDEQLCAIATHNFHILGLDNVTTICADAETVLSPLTFHSSLFTHHSSPLTLIYLDPARRDTHGAAQIVNGKYVNRKYIALADCIPNVITMMPDLLRCASHVMLKLSPMLDWRKAVADLAPHHVSEIHIVAVDNECKELLLILAPPTEDSHRGQPQQETPTERTTPCGCNPRITCADIHSRDGSCAIYTPGISNYSFPLSGETQRVGELCSGMEPRVGELSSRMEPRESELCSGMEPRVGELSSGMEPREGELPSGIEPRVGELPSGMEPREGELCSGMEPRVGELPSGMEPREGELSSGIEPRVGELCMGMEPKVGSFLYEPNAAVMKSGCFRELSEDFGIAQLSANSHLFCSDRLINDFPGRRFRLQAICSMNKRELKATLGHLRQANIAVRNFPLTAAQLRQRLKLSDGGTDYIFATTLANDSHTLLLCSK